jgi:prephenate dehydrogenase
LWGRTPSLDPKKTGVENALASLFQKTRCVIVRSKNSQANRVVKKMWEDVGSQCVFLPANLHDKFLSLTSHLPHLLAFSLFSIVHKEAKTKKILQSLTAGSFRDMTRIAAADANVWSGISAMNRVQIKKSFQLFQEEIQTLLSMPSREMRNSLQKISHNKKKWQ